MKEVASISVTPARFPVLGVTGPDTAIVGESLRCLASIANAAGLRVVVVGHDRQIAQLPDMYRCSVPENAVSGEPEQFCPTHLGQFFDLVLVAGMLRQGTSLWIAPIHEELPKLRGGQILIRSDGQQVGAMSLGEWLQEWLECQCRENPVWACILIGGQSSRMGEAKHLLPALNRNDATWLENTVAIVAPLVDQVILSGRGQVPDSLGALPRLVDTPGLAGPMAGILAAFRYNPGVHWLVLACDLPCLQSEAIRWLLARKRAGVRAILPILPGRDGVEPLFALYSPQCGPILEDLAAKGQRRLSRLNEYQAVETPSPPSRLHRSWCNVNTPVELRALYE
ncbi:MAG: hypothetical protein CSA34_07215 [Desulfobulbus propionicus]|nr:MAG: hypothetical protein CSA34_07215 [Desulfobulbus propionicus]